LHDLAVGKVVQILPGPGCSGPQIDRCAEHFVARLDDIGGASGVDCALARGDHGAGHVLLFLQRRRAESGNLTAGDGDGAAANAVPENRMELTDMVFSLLAGAVFGAVPVPERWHAGPAKIIRLQSRGGYL
jgi:hypothetical protein